MHEEDQNGMLHARLGKKIHRGFSEDSNRFRINRGTPSISRLKSVLSSSCTVCSQVKNKNNHTQNVQIGNLVRIEFERFELFLFNKV